MSNEEIGFGDETLFLVMYFSIKTEREKYEIRKFKRETFRKLNAELH